ncbi:hypothetical protein V9T40_004901 [Parthenolecanium corni]|uniref:Uncharacterized protein n=1 Tax=Parthenolecanium corni TaxID=536013 RepID=A0AAN9Y3Q5_9HEMI
MEQEKTNNQDDNDSGYSGEEEALYILKKKRTKAQDRYRKANAAVIPNFIPPEEREAADYVLKETQVYTPYHGIEEQQGTFDNPTFYASTIQNNMDG